MAETRTELDNAHASFNPGFTQEESRRWVKQLGLELKPSQLTSLTTQGILVSRVTYRPAFWR